MRVMRRARLLFAALLLVGLVLGVPFHAATAHSMDHFAAGNSHPVVAQENGTKGCCAPGNVNEPGVACQAACSLAVAVLDTPPRLATHLAYAVQFAPSRPLVGRGVMLALDPYPPRRSRIA